MAPDDRLVLIDLENVVGFRPKLPAVRARVSALLDAAGPHHHAVAAYGTADDPADDSIASLLAALGVAPLRVVPGRHAAEQALLAHARRMQTEGCARFTVCSGDHAFAALADTDATDLEVVIWQGQPLSTRLHDAARQVRRLPYPGTQRADTTEASAPAEAPEDTAVEPGSHPRRDVVPLSGLAAGVLIGVGIAVGHRLADLLLHRPVRRRH